MSPRLERIGAAVNNSRRRPLLGSPTGAILAALFALLFVAVRLGPIAGPAPAAAVTENRVLEIVQTGPEPDAPVKTSCVRFTEESISGAEALRRASDVEGWDVQFASYGGMGQAICAICHVGCSSSDCFCDPKKFWAYDRAPAGSSTFRQSSVGASSTRLSDGDVEGWRWGEGQPPPYTSVVAACGGPEPVVRTTSSTTTSTTSDTAVGSAGGSEPPLDSPTTSPVLIRPATSTPSVDPSHLGSAAPRLGETTSTSVEAAGATPGSPPTANGDSSSAAPTTSTTTRTVGGQTALGVGRPGGGFDPAWIAYLAILVGIGALWWRARRARLRAR